MTYNVFNGTLNPAQSINQSRECGMNVDIPTAMKEFSEARKVRHIANFGTDLGINLEIRASVHLRLRYLYGLLV